MAAAQMNAFQRSSVSMWVVDLTEMRLELEASGLTGLPDLGRRLDECPELIARAVRSIKVIDVNDATLRLFETDDKDALLGPLPILLEATGLAGFRPLIVDEGAELAAKAAARTFAGRELALILSARVPRGTDEDPLMLVSAIDITARARRDRSLEKERALLLTTINSLPDLIYSKDSESRFVFANRATVEWFGLPNAAALIGKTDHELFPQALADTYLAVERRILQTGLKQVQVLEPGETAGSSRWVLTTKIPVTDDEGKVVGIVGMGRDITEARHLEQRLERERALLQTVINNIPDHIYLKDRDSRFLLANRALAEWIGASRPEELIGRTDHDYFPRDLADEFRADEARILESGQSQISKEERSQSTTGENRWVLTTKMPVTDDAGAVIGIVGIGRDIAERKHMEERSLRLATLVESADDAIIGLDLQESITSWNGGAERVYGYAAERVIGRSIGLLVPPECAEERRRITDRVRGGETVAHFESIRLREGGARINVSIGFFPIRDAQGAITGLASISRDITEQKKLQARIERAQRLESVVTMAAGIAHQFNNINAVVKGYIDAALQSGELPETIVAYLREALKGVQRMVDVTERVRGLVPSPHSVLERIHVEIVARAILPLFKKPIEEQGVTLRLELLDTAAVRIDPSRFGFIVMSLITNALHAVMEQPVRIVTLRSGADSASVFLEVEDTGCGIPPEGMARLFEPFFTTKGEWAPEGSPQANVKGVGLSLAVCQSTVAECGGKIEVQSEPGKGSRFRVVLPIDEPGPAPTLPTP